MYLLTFIILAVVFLLSNKIKSKKIQHLLCIIPIVVVVVLRYGIGADYFSYEYIYNFLDISSIGAMFDSMDNIEPGFKLFFYLGRLLSLNYHLVISLLSLLMLGAVGLLIADKSENVPLSYLLYYSCFFFPWNLNAIRQGLAIAFSLYILFGNLKISLRFKASLILILMGFHLSVIIVLPLYFFSKFEISRRTITYILLGSVLFSFLPINQLLKLFENIPFLSKLAFYASENSGFIDFQTISRLVILTPIILFYDALKDQRMARFSLISFALYFALKSNEIIASRLSIYGMFLIILLYSEIYIVLGNKKLVQISSAIALFVFSTLFYLKEFETASRQGKYLGRPNEINKINVFNKGDYENDFLNRYNLITQSSKLCSIDRNNFFENQDFDRIVIDNYQEGDTFVSVKFPNEYFGVINQRGEIIVGGDYSTTPEIFGSVMKVSTSGSHFKRDIYYDLKTMEPIDPEIAIPLVIIENEKSLYFGSSWFNLRQMYFEELGGTVLPTIIKENVYTSIALFSFSQPFWYNVVEVSALENSFMVFVDNKLNQMGNRLYNYVERFDLSYMARGFNTCGTEVINQYGEVIWFEN